MNAVQAWQLSNGDIFSLGNEVYQFSNGYLKVMVESEADENGMPTYSNTGEIISVAEADLRFQDEQIVEKEVEEEVVSFTEYQKQHVSNVEYFNNGKTTVAILTMKNGFDVVGTSSCVHRDSFDSKMGEEFALTDALEKMASFIGFGRQQEAYEQKMYLQEQKEIERVEAEMAMEEAEKRAYEKENIEVRDEVNEANIDSKVFWDVLNQNTVFKPKDIEQILHSLHGVSTVTLENHFDDRQTTLTVHCSAQPKMDSGKFAENIMKHLEKGIRLS